MYMNLLGIAVLVQHTCKFVEVSCLVHAFFVSSRQVKNHLWVFVNCLIENPSFDSQTKENMTLQMKSFGSKCVLNEKFITQVGIVDSRIR